MAGYEYEAEEVVADVIVERGVEVGHGPLLLVLQLATKLLVLALKPFVSAEGIDRTVLRSGHEPSARIVRDARFLPLLERGDKSVLREFLGKADIAHHPRETGDDPGRLNPPDCIDGAMCVGSRHGYSSHHLRFARASPGAPRLNVRGHSYARELLCFGTEVFRLEHLANLGLAFPSRPVFFVKFHKVPRPFDRLCFRLQFKLRIPADNLLSLGEWSVDHGKLPPGESDAGARSSWEESPAADHRAGFDGLFAELPNGVH